MFKQLFFYICFLFLSILIFGQGKQAVVPKYYFVSAITSSWTDSSLAKKYFGKQSLLPEIKKMIPNAYCASDSNKFNIIIDFTEAKLIEKVKGVILACQLKVKIQLNYLTEKGIEKLSDLEFNAEGDMLANKRQIELQKYWKKIINSTLENIDTYLASGKDKLPLPFKPVLVNVQYSPDNIDNKDTLVFNINRKLRPEDFKGQPDKLSNAGGATYSGIGIDYDVVIKDFTPIVEVKATCIFDKEKSWLLDAAKDNANILKHEQLHFDICYWQTLAFMKILKEKNFSMSTLKVNLEKVYREKFKAYEALQEQYDEATDHGLKKEEQIKWEAIVAEKINSLQK
jgi:hypothetical protein